MKAIRSAFVVISVAALGACEGGLVDAPVPPSSPISAPVAYASPNTASQTICSSPTTTELSYEREVWFPAFPTDRQSAYGATIPGSSWVAPVPDGGTKSALPGTSYYRTSFILPEGAKNVTLEGVVHADNQATFFVNGVEFYQQQPPLSYGNFQDPADAFSTRRDFVDGLNVVRVDLLNIGEGDGTLPSAAALDFCYTVSYMAPTDGGGGGGSGAKGCPAAPSIAAHYLQSLGLQPTSVGGKNIIALVADHMTQGARFQGLDKCAVGYAPAVVAYVNAHLP